jgi:hypothetical protein
MEEACSASFVLYNVMSLGSICDGIYSGTNSSQLAGPDGLAAMTSVTTLFLRHSLRCHRQAPLSARLGELGGAEQRNASRDNKNMFTLHLAGRKLSEWLEVFILVER